jgi:uncharacterized protein YndB with AHSA1/START domain
MSIAIEKGITTQVFRVFIKASPQAIWDAITRSEWIEQYGYGGTAEFDLRPGGAYRALASEAMKAYGSPEVIIVGQIISSDPPRKLVQTWHPVWDPDSAAEEPTTLTYELLEQPGGITRLTVIHELAGAPLTAKMVAGEVENAGGGWSWVLSDLKSLLETGKSMGA